MREIKFRAWHVGNEEMVYFQPKVLSRDSFQAAHLMNLMDEKSKYLMQFTGLKDKNGKEIFESDVVKSGDENLVVIYQAPSFVMKNKIKKGYSKAWHEFIRHPSENQFEEIIGNIYENPELLETSSNIPTDAHTGGESKS